MRIRAIAATVLAVIAIGSLSGCNNSGTSGDNDNENVSFDCNADSDVIKAFLAGMNTNIQNNGLNNFVLSHSFKYTMISENTVSHETNIVEDEESGIAELCYLSENTDDNNSFNFSELLKKKEGYLKGAESIKMNITNIDAKGKKKAEDPEEFSSDISRSFTIKTDDNDLYYIGENSNSSSESASNVSTNSYNGKIEKSLMSSVPEDTMNMIQSNLFQSKAWEYISGVSDIVGYASEQLNTDDNAAVNEFIKTHNIKIERGGDAISLSFEFDTKDVISKQSGTDDIIGSKIKGEMKLDKGYGKLISYKYDLSDYCSVIIDSMDDDDENISVDVNSFIVEMKVTDSSPSDLKLDERFTEYNKDNVLEFMEMFTKGLSEI